MRGAYQQTRTGADNEHRPGMAYATFDIDAAVARAVGEEVWQTEAEAGDEEVGGYPPYGRAPAPSVRASPRSNLRKRFVRAEMVLLPLSYMMHERLL